MKFEAHPERHPIEYRYPQHDDWGFAGEIRRLFKLPEDAGERIWLNACLIIEREFSVKDRRFVRNFLRSGWGRHLADDLTWILKSNTPSEVKIIRALEETRWKSWGKCFNSIVRDTREGLWDSENR